MKTRIAVYGTLKKGEGNHLLLKTAEFVGDGKVNAVMLSAGGFPVCHSVGDSTYDSYDASKPSTVVELYDVDDQTLARLDSLEGHPHWYERKVVVTTAGPAWMYLMPKENTTRLVSMEAGEGNVYCW